MEVGIIGGEALGREGIPAALLQSFTNFPDPENQDRVRSVFTRLRSDIVSRFGEDFAKDLAEMLGIRQE